MSIKYLRPFFEDDSYEHLFPLSGESALISFVNLILKVKYVVTTAKCKINVANKTSVNRNLIYTFAEFNNYHLPRKSSHRASLVPHTATSRPQVASG